jgi:hypothetical protein
MKNIIKIFLILVLVQTAAAQNFKIGLNVGYGIYQMNDLQDVQSSAAYTYSNFHVEEVQQFPGYINYSASVDYFLNSKNLLGLHAAFYSTGGRNHVSDYSGEYYLNMLVDSYHIGLQYQYIFRSENKLKYYARLKGGISFSNLTVDESMTIHQVDSASGTYKFAATSFYAEPSLGAYYALSDKFGVNFSLGYQVDIPGDLHTKGNKDQKMGGSDSPVQINWSGIRIEAGIAYYLFKE